MRGTECLERRWSRWKRGRRHHRPVGHRGLIEGVLQETREQQVMQMRFADVLIQGGRLDAAETASDLQRLHPVTTQKTAVVFSRRAKRYG